MVTVVGRLFLPQQVGLPPEGRVVARPTGSGRRCLELARRALFRGDLDDPERAVVIFSRKLGDALARAGYLTDAEGILREALDLAGPADTDRARLLEGLAKVARARERFPEATALLKEAIATAGRSGARELQQNLQQLEMKWRAA